MTEKDDTFKQMTQTRIVRLSLYPVINPTVYVVAFEVRCTSNDRSQYFETSVPVDEVKGYSHEKIARVAWKQVKTEAHEWFGEERAKNVIIGSIFHADSDDNEDENDDHSEKEEEEAAENVMDGKIVNKHGEGSESDKDSYEDDG